MTYPRTTGKETLPLSTAQRGMWVGSQLAPKGAVFNLAEAIELHGAVDGPLLCRALRQVTQEMETLRVRIVTHGLMARQAVAVAFDDPIPLIDVSGEAEPEAAAQAWMMAELSAPVDFETGAVWASAVLKLGEDHWCWYHRAHHIMLDGFSGGMVVRRVAEIYTALRQGREPEPAPFAPLSTLIEAEDAYRGSDRYAKDRAYWLERMAALPEPVTLARRPRAPVGGLLRATASLPQAAVERLKARVAGLNVSLPQALIALTAAYFHRVTGAEDLVLGMPVTARVGGHMRRCAGMVANAVPLRLSITGEDRFDDLFAQTAKAVREALRHQQYRYEDLRRDLGLLNEGRQIARLGVNIEPFDYELTFDGVRATPHNLSNAHMEDLTVFVYDRSDGTGLRIDLDANPGLYAKAELEAHLGRLRRLIEAAVADPGLAVGEVELMTPEEQARLAAEWNDTAETGPTPTVPEQFAAQAARQPEAVAVRLDSLVGRSLTYRQVEALSRTLAGRLEAMGLGPGSRVAIALPRSEHLPVALLGVMRSGAAYLPLDPDGLHERTALILEDARPACVLTTAENAPWFEARGHACLLLEEALAGPAPARLSWIPDPGAVAYVLHTSGSTGRPKGVVVTHGNLANFMAGMRAVLRPTPEDRLLAVTTVSFDIAGLELLLPLVSGGRVVVASQAAARDPLAVAGLIRKEGITRLQATPSFWRILLAHAEAPLGAIHALVGGETLPPDLAARLLARARKVTNLYGPTETTIWSTVMDLTADDLDPPPIGRPIRNTRAHVLDARMRPVPVGVAGRLFIGGDGVAAGYHDRPALTAQRFVADPSGDPGARLYRTGDLARWREDGVLEYLGREDDQVKIRGYRIEPAEVEFVLGRHPDVAEAAVAARPDPAGTLQLVAYLVLAGAREPGREELKACLAGQLPDYMIPSAFVVLEAMPRTANGKLDRKALPLPARDRDERRPQAPPRTETERRLLSIWRQLLKRDDIGVFDNFFELGGDSLSATELFIAVCEDFSREIPFASLFRASTIAGLAELLDSAPEDDPLETLLPLKTEGTRAPLFCVHPVIGFGWSYAALMRHLDPEQPLYALQAPGLKAGGERPASVEQLAERYLGEIRRVQPEGPYHLLGWSFGGLVAHAMAARLRALGQDVARLVLLDSYPFVLAGASGSSEDEARQAELALAFLGLPLPADPPRTMAALADHLCGEYDLMSQPVVQAVLRDDDDVVRRLGRVVGDHMALARRYNPPAVDVDVVFCHASARTTDRLNGVLHYQPEAWRGRVRRLQVHDIPCHHQDILSPAAAARIGGILRGRDGRSFGHADEDSLSLRPAAPLRRHGPGRLRRDDDAALGGPPRAFRP